MTDAFFVAAGLRYEVSLRPVDRALAVRRRARALKAAPGAARPVPSVDMEQVRRVIRESPVLASRVSDVTALSVADVAPRARRAARAGALAPAAPRNAPHVLTFATETVITEGLRQADVAAARDRLGARIVDESLDGKALLRVGSVEDAFELVALLLERDVATAAPNFIRRMAHRAPSAPQGGWALGKIRAPAAWKTTRGLPDLRVAILDEGTDTRHPALRPALVAERDFIGGNESSAAPSGDDAHGTACAGIAVSRDEAYSGVAPGCSLIAARIGMGDGAQGWVFDDYQTADAIDWCWRQGADVLSNSWGGGAPSDAIARAFGRAATQGRNGKGAVVVIAAGNHEEEIDFPGNLPGFVTVGASNRADERKTLTSSDGESWWGSCFGPSLVLLAPGVSIWTTDITGPAGYDRGDFTKTFNGTSAATPHVAGAAALMLSVNPDMAASDVRTMLGRTATPLRGQTGWTQELGHGRLDVAAAVAAAKASAAPRAKARRKRPGASTRRGRRSRRAA